MNLVACSQIIGLSIREDIGKMFEAHNVELTKYEHGILNIMKNNSESSSGAWTLEGTFFLIRINKIRM